MSRTAKRIVVVVSIAFFGLVLADTLGAFDQRDYFEVPHGNHSHFVPKDRDTSIPISQFPTRPPNDNERILPDGQIVPR